jgi:hypothetical protein
MLIIALVIANVDRILFGEKVEQVIVKIMKLLVKMQKWLLEHMNINKDSLVYEDYYYPIQKHEKEIERIERESKI